MFMCVGSMSVPGQLTGNAEKNNSDERERDGERESGLGEKGCAGENGGREKRLRCREREDGKRTEFGRIAKRSRRR